MSHRRSRSATAMHKGLAHHDGGSILVQFALMLGVLIAILGIVDIGYMYYAKRDLQRIADLAAIEAVQNIDFGAKTPAENCSDGGLQSLNKNWPMAVNRDAANTSVTCGNWSPENTGDRHFSANGELNAAHVTTQGTSLTILPGLWSRTITAEAVAKRNAPLVNFSVGTTLVNVGCNQQLAPLIQILKIVGVGDPCVEVSGYEGLVDAQVSASGLMKALGVPLDASLTVADVNDLLVAKKVSLGSLLDTALTLGGHSDLLGLNAKILSLLGVQLGVDALNLEVPLGSGSAGPGIFAGIYAPDETSATALDVDLSVLDIVTAAVGVGTTGRGISIPGLSVQVPGILPNLLQVKAGIIEPPSIGIGGVGTTAYNAQIRLYANVDTTGGVLGGLLQLLGTQIKLPIYVDVARSKGVVEEITCKVPGKESTARIRVDASVAEACIGKTAGDPFSTRTPICESLENETLISVLGLVNIKNQIHISALEDSYTSPEIKVGETWTTPGNSLNLGTTLSDLVNELLRLVGELLGAPGESAWTPAENEQAAQSMSDYYLGVGSNALSALPTVKLGLGGPDGAYNIDELVNRLSAAIDRSGQGCLLGIPILCWTTNEWQRWGNNVGDVSGGIIVSKYIGGGSCYLSAKGNVMNFNNCIRSSLAQEFLKSPTNKPKNFLQVLLAPLLSVLSDILNPLGNLLAGSVLRDLLGIQLGLNDVKVNSVGCGSAQLVY